jgi:hypothetical protein
MYINLYPNRQLRAAKRNLLITGVLTASGSAFALLRETIWRNEPRVEWVVASAVLLVVSLVFLAIAADRIHLPDAYFSMTPERIRYRLSLLGREHQLLWKDVRALQVSKQLVVFKQSGGEMVRLRLGLIQQWSTAQHVSRSILLAALEKGIPVNGIKAMPHESSQ